jgi:osmoprotectant transport system substrate-binding protein
MIRKHTRRAAKAAYSVALGVALLIGGAAAATAAPDREDRASQSTPIIIGTKNFGEAFVLGQLYKQALEAKGFRVQYRENIGSTELITRALTSGRITMYPEYIGIALTATFGRKSFPRTAAQTHAQVKRLWGARGYAVLNRTPFQDVDAVAVLTSTARQFGLRTVSDLKKVPDLTLAAFPEFRTRQTGLVGMRRVYGITDVDFTPLAGISAYKLLDDKKVLAAGVFSTDPPLATAKYRVLRDPRNIFGFQNVAPIVSNKLVQQHGSRLVSTLNAVSAKLTLRAMLAMNKAVYVDQRPAARIADAFLKANGLK